MRATGHWNNLPIKWWTPKCFDTSKIHVDHLFRPCQEKLDQINLKAPSKPSILILCRFSFIAKLHASVTIVHLPAYLLLQSIRYLRKNIYNYKLDNRLLRNREFFKKQTCHLLSLLYCSAIYDAEIAYGFSSCLKSLNTARHL